MSRCSVAAVLSAGMLVACSSSIPRLHQPDRIQAFCGDRVPIVTAIESVVASTSDQPEHIVVPTRGAIAKMVKDSGGLLAHWNAQPLYLPNVAKTVGAGGDYVTLGDVAIENGPTSGDSRRIYLTANTKSGPQTFALRAFDVQDVCNEGKLKS